MRIHRDIEQGSPDWFALRIGKATASCFADVLAKGQGKTRARYLRRVIAETLIGKPLESLAYGAWQANLDRGHEQEPLAAMAYQLATDNILERVAFIDHDAVRAGCSPDGLILGQKKGAEIKCVIPTVQIETILAGGYPSEHKAQIQGSMWITGFDAWDFCSYSPDMPAHLRTYIYTVQRDDAYIKALEVEVQTFLNEVDSTIRRLNASQQDVEGLLRKSLKVAA